MSKTHPRGWPRRLSVACAAALAGLAAETPADYSGLAAEMAARDYSWQKPHAEVLPTGDLKWKPEPFRLVKTGPVRYIDFAAGRDDQDGESTAKPWKHHPWDPAATGKAAACRGPMTYVFKRGVIYRGHLTVRESGRAGEPIRLTSDPSWGKGEAVLCGSQTVTGWKKGADLADLPQREKVYQADLDFAPRCLWSVRGGKVTRLTLARTPNWRVDNPDDIKSQWWTWENPQWWKDGGHKTRGASGRIHLGIDAKHLTKPAAYYRGATVWSEWGIVMGTPFPSRVEAVDPARKAIGFQGVWYGDSGTIIRGNRYYLEDKPHYLDEPGEFYFRKAGPGGRLYLRLPGDADPARVRIEAARHHSLIDASRMSHVHVSGLTFRFTNVYWDLGARSFIHRDVDAACVRLLGSGKDIRVSHCRFEHVNKAVRIKAVGKNDRVDDVAITDNDIAETDHGAIDVENGAGWGTVQPPIGMLGHVEILRNRLRRVGLRPIRSQHGHAVCIIFPETAHIAGNMLYRCYGAGLFVFGGKGSGEVRDVPFGRILMHHNKVIDPLLNTNDWGGIESWQGGPFYVFNNICGNPGGYWHWAYNAKKPASARFGHAYYLDGSFKNYHFNNIAWGKSKDPNSPLGNTAAFQEIHSYQNTFFNNTVYNFVKGTRRQAPHAGRDKFLGNVWEGIGEWLFWHAQPAKSAPEGNAAHAGPQKEHFAYETNAYGHNVFHDVAGTFGVFETSGRWHGGAASFAQALVEHKALAADVGTEADKPILRDPGRGDFRLSKASAAIDRGTTVFVPWSLHGVVGEWHFTPNRADPAVVIDEHWYLTGYHIDRTDYYTRPTYPLQGVNVGAADYVPGTLEDWTHGALRLNGRDQYLKLPHADLTKPFEYDTKAKARSGGWVTVTAPRSVAPGQKFDVQLKLPQAVAGQKITAHLHWLKKDGFGGFNAWGGLARPAGVGPHRFTFTAVDKVGLESFLLTVFLSPTGDWKDQTKVARVAIAKAAEAGELKSRTVSIGAGESTTRVRVAAEALRNADVHDTSLLLEAYFKTEPGHTLGGIVCKSDGKRGYELFLDAGGRVTFLLRGKNTVSAGTRRKVNDGRWHHVLVEYDRPGEALRVYLDGTMAVDLRGEPVGGGLSNPADLLVGRSAKGKCLAGEIDFLRIALGTLKDARTTIEELTAWQFDGPQLRDFSGRKPVGRRDAGALESGTD